MPFRPATEIVQQEEIRLVGALNLNLIGSTNPQPDFEVSVLALSP